LLCHGEKLLTKDCVVHVPRLATRALRFLPIPLGAALLRLHADASPKLGQTALRCEGFH
jgi:hypothetical protein